MTRDADIAIAAVRNRAELLAKRLADPHRHAFVECGCGYVREPLIARQHCRHCIRPSTEHSQPVAETESAAGGSRHLTSGNPSVSTTGSPRINADVPASG